MIGQVRRHSVALAVDLLPVNFVDRIDCHWLKSGRLDVNYFGHTEVLHVFSIAIIALFLLGKYLLKKRLLVASSFGLHVLPLGFDNVFVHPLDGLGRSPQALVFAILVGRNLFEGALQAPHSSDLDLPILHFGTAVRPQNHV